MSQQGEEGLTGPSRGAGRPRRRSAREALLDPTERGRQLVRLAVPFYMGLAGLAWAWRGGFRSEPIFHAPGLEAADVWPPGEAAALGLVLGLAIVAVSAAWTTWLPSGRVVSEFLGQTIGRIGLAQSTLLALVSGLGEEMLFRGALQPEVGLVAASLIFGLAHLVPRWPMVLWSLYAVAIGVVLGWVFEVTGSLWAPIVAHAVVNGVNLPILSRRYGGQPPAARSAPGSAAFDDARDGVHLDERAER